MRSVAAGFALLAFWPALAAAQARCAMAGSERQWIETSLQAWDHVAAGRLELEAQPHPSIVVFDANCRFERASGKTVWVGQPHNGSIRLPDGNEVPAQVTSFAGEDDRTRTPFFVMALPSIWEAAGIPIARDRNGLTAVFLHEFAHTRQIRPLKPVFETAEAVRKMPDDFSDDSLQKRFEADPTYVAVVEKEMSLLFRAAAEPDRNAAKTLAREALALMEARQKRWFVADDAYWKNYDDLFTTMEGFGQWVAYAWLADPNGGRMQPAAARDKMAGTRWWSQNAGLALFLVIDRFVPDWPERAFADRPALGIDLLRLVAADDGS